VVQVMAVPEQFVGSSLARGEAHEKATMAGPYCYNCMFRERRRGTVTSRRDGTHDGRVWRSAALRAGLT